MVSFYVGQRNAMNGTAFIIDMKDTKDGGAMTQNKTSRYIAVEKDTPDVPRAWGEGKTDLIARYQCEIALREKLLGKIERGCQEQYAQTHLYVIRKEN